MFVFFFFTQILHLFWNGDGHTVYSEKLRGNRSEIKAEAGKRENLTLKGFIFQHKTFNLAGFLGLKNAKYINYNGQYVVVNLSSLI